MPSTRLPEYFGKDLEAMSFAKNYHDWILSEFRDFLGNSVAEVGAGVGSFSELLLKTKIERLTAFEPSANMFPLLQAATGEDNRCEAIQGFLANRPAEGLFDSVLYINVLEHIENDAAELRLARDSLHSGGHLIIFVPALPWLYSDVIRSVGHFRRYLKKPLLQLIQDTGLKVVRARYFDIAGILPWYISFVLLKNQMGGASVAIYDKLVVPIMRVAENILAPPVGKNLLIIARKD